MIVNVVEIMVEYAAIIMCMHKAAGKKMAIDRYVVLFSLINIINVFVAHSYYEECRYLMLVMYISFIAYSKLRLAKKWMESIKIFGVMFITIPCLQLLMFYVVKFVFIIFNVSQSKHIMGLISNCMVCLFIVLWKKEYIYKVVRQLGKSKGLLVAVLFCLFSVNLLYIYKPSEYVYKAITTQLLSVIVCAGTIAILWVSAENDKMMKAKELQVYQLYTKTFEEAITAIRIRQHEFENHINAIKCLQLTISNKDELIEAQNEYCDMVLRENSFNRILKIQMEPILTGFLYSKFMGAKKQGIEIFHEIHLIEFRNKIGLNELIEVIGVLFDNAVEALLDEKSNHKFLIIKVIQESEEKISIEVANRSRKYLNKEIEQFCVCGYSTKGKNRGVGLSRVKEIVHMHRANFLIGNVNYNGNNYLSFKIVL